jgi:hypothetical protein
MKPPTLTAMALCLAMKGFAQSAPPNQSLTSTDFVSAIQATTSQGYLYWKEVPNAVYKVNLYKKMGSNFIFTTAFNSNKNYLKLSSDVLAGKNMYYELIALNQLNGNTLLMGEKTPVKVEMSYKSGSLGSGDDEGTTGIDPYAFCRKKCNGPDYAYELVIYMFPNNAEPGFMGLEGTYESTNNGYNLPFYEAISLQNWNLLPNSHPYKAYNYPKVQIITNTSGTAQYWDKMNQPVYDGWRVAKYTNKFTHMTTAATSATPDPNAYCPATTTNLWISFFNNYTTPADFSQVVWNGYNAQNTQVLECQSWYIDGPGVNPDDILNQHEPEDFSNLTDCLFDAVLDSEDWWHCFEVYGFSPNVTPEKPNEPAVDFDRPLTDKPIETKPRIAGIDVSPISSLDEDAANFQLVIDEKGANYHYRTQGLKNGLYNVAYIFSDGTIIPIVTELNFPDKIVSNKEKVEVKISPNKIENNLINLDLNALDNVRFKLEIKDLAGALIYSEQIDMKKAEQLNKKIAVSSANVAYNQLRLNLLFEDGSSIQQTILK